MKIQTFVHIHDDSPNGRSGGDSDRDVGSSTQWRLPEESLTRTISPSVLIEFRTSDASNVHQGKLKVCVHGVWSDIGLCLIFLSPPVDRSTPGPRATKEPIPWLEFTARCGTAATILPRRSSYRDLIGLIGEEEALTALAQMNDISALRLANRNSSKLASFMRLAELVRLLSVDTEAFLAYTTLSQLIGQNWAASSPPPDRLTCDVNLGEDCSPFELQFPNDDLKGRQVINAIIGPNGSGKTRALCALARRSSSERGSWPRRVLLYMQDRSGGRDNGVHQSSSLKIRLVKPKWSDATRRLEDISIRCSSDPSEVEVIARLFAGVVPISSLYVPLNSETIYGAGIGDVVQHGPVDYVSYEHYLHGICSGNRLLLQHGIPPLIGDGQGSLFPPSSGESTILGLLTSILVEATGETLVLIDEPETNLHPRFITLLMARLSDMLLATNSLAVFATHSPFVVRELDKSAVTVMKRTRSQLTQVFYPTLQTHGASIGEICSYVFDDDEADKGFESAIEAISINRSLSREGTIRMAIDNFGADGISFAVTRGTK